MLPREGAGSRAQTQGNVTGMPPLEKTVFDRIKRVFWNAELDLKGIPHGTGYSCIPPVYLSGRIRFGDNVALNRNVTIDATDGGFISLGNNVSIGMNTVLRASNHDYRNGGHVPGILICNDVWIGANCVILPDVTIERGCVIGAGSIVTKSMPENWVCAGNPCKPIHEIEK